MDTAGIRARLSDHHVEAHPDYALSISSQVLRAEIDGVPLVAVGGDRPSGVQITGLLDALHFWVVRHGGQGPLRYVVGSRADETETRGVLDALAGLTDALAEDVELRVEVDFEPVDLI